MTNQAFNQWCAKQEGRDLLEYGTPDYATDLAAMLRVCRKQGWRAVQVQDDEAKELKPYGGCKAVIIIPPPYFSCATGEAGTAEAALRAALVKVMESEN